MSRKKKEAVPALTPEEAQLLMDAHDIGMLFLDEEECDLLAANNPDLLAAYTKLREIAGVGDNG